MHSSRKLRYFLLIVIFFLLDAAKLPILSAGAPETVSRRAITTVAYDPQSGQFIDIRPEQIQISGISARAVRCERLAGPRHNILLLDLSSSSRTVAVTRQNLFETARGFIAQFRTDDWLALHVFAKRNRVLVPFCQDPLRILGALNSVRSKTNSELSKEYGSGTYLPKALLDSPAISRADMRFGDAIVIIGDGIFTNEHKKDVHRELISHGIRLYLLQAKSLFDKSVRLEQRIAGTDVEKTRIIASMTAWPKELIARQESMVLPAGGAVVYVIPQSEEIKLIYPGELRIGNPRQPFALKWISNASVVLLGLIRNAFKVDLEILEPVRKPRRIKLKLQDRLTDKKQNVPLQYQQWIFPSNRE